MAPEQILEDAKAIGPATDVYEMGVILYELLTAYLPFEGPLAAVYGQILHAQPEPPSVRRPGIDAALDAVCLKALAKKPAERFASMAAFAEALKPWACPVAAVAEPPPIAPLPQTLLDVPRLTCPGCGKSLKVPPAAAGKRLKCPRVRRSSPERARPRKTALPGSAGSADTAAPSLLETMAAPPPRLQGQGSRTLLLGVGLAVLAVVLLVVGARLLLPGGEQPVPSLPAKVVEEPSVPKDKAPPLGVIPSLRLLPLEPILVAPGESKTVTVTIKRRNCRGPIEIRVAGLPTGVTAGKGVVGNEEDAGMVTVVVTEGVKPGSYTLRLLAIAAAAREEGELRLTIREARLAKELRNSLGMKLMLIPKGTFTMGSPKEEKDRSDDEEQHEVEITRPFYMGATEVTQEQYEKVMGTNPSYFASTGDGKDKVQGLDTRRFPVETVSWKDAVEFCEKLSELPEEKKAGACTACRPRRNGNMLVGEGLLLQSPFTSAILFPPLRPTSPTPSLGEQPRSAPIRRQTALGCSTCMGMSGSGAPIGMANIPKAILPSKILQAR